MSIMKKAQAIFTTARKCQISTSYMEPFEKADVVAPLGHALWLQDHDGFTVHTEVPNLFYQCFVSEIFSG